MKVLALLLAFAVAAVQSRSAEPTTEVGRATLAVEGEAPWFVHLRKALRTSGYLRTCGGALISTRYLLTTATCLEDASFVWARFGALNVYTPKLVIESSSVTLHPDSGNLFSSANVALLNLNRNVVFTNAIFPIVIGRGRPARGTFCHFGEDKHGNPGTDLKCFVGTLSAAALFSNEIEIDSKDGVATQHDIGAPLVNAEKQLIGLLIKYSGWMNSNEGTFLRPSNHLDWINEQIGSGL